jgi:hypothetical protein
MKETDAVGAQGAKGTVPAFTEEVAGNSRKFLALF